MTVYEVKSWRYICNICGLASDIIESRYEPPYPTGWGPIKLIDPDKTITACYVCFHKELPWPLEEKK